MFYFKKADIMTPYIPRRRDTLSKQKWKVSLYFVTRWFAIIRPDYDTYNSGHK